MNKSTTVLDARTARSLAKGQWASRAISGTRGSGVLQARGLSNGSVTFYFRVTTSAGTRERIPLGTIPYRAAVQKATELSCRYQSGERDLYSILKSEQAEKTNKQREKEERTKHTLGALLSAYIDQLTRDGKRSTPDVQRRISLHVEQAWPNLWSKPADKITTDDLMQVVALLTENGKLSTARMIRSYLKTAYNCAISARYDPSALAALRDFHISTNPATNLATVKGSHTAKDRALSLAELQAYWRRINQLSELDSNLLKFHLLTGGQRIEQLSRATLADYDKDTQTLRLFDPKGRRDEARVHLVPLIPAALASMHKMHGNHHVFTVTAGKSGASNAALRKRLLLVVSMMAKAGELERGPFTLGDIRRTVETRLSAAGVGQLIRGHLQSHGLGGVQNRHYDKHDYLAEKRGALNLLYQLATGATSTP